MDEPPYAQRFWEKVDKRGPDECWRWMGAKSPKGYGHFKIKGVQYGAHRTAWELGSGQPIPRGLLVCHHCDNPSCVNPAHLFVGTQKDNLRDRDNKGRCNYRAGDEHWSRRRPELMARGERLGRSNLTEDDIRAIRERRAAGETFQALADAYGVARITVQKIAWRQTWAHVR